MRIRVLYDNKIVGAIERDLSGVDHRPSASHFRIGDVNYAVEIVPFWVDDKDQPRGPFYDSSLPWGLPQLRVEFFYVLNNFPQLIGSLPGWIRESPKPIITL